MSASGLIWTASPIKRYGYGAGLAHPSVEHVACPVCDAPKGSLCIGDDGDPYLDRHYKRCDAYRDLKRKPGGGTACGFRGCCRPARVSLMSSNGAHREALCCYSCGIKFGECR